MTTAERPARVLIADDHAYTRAGIRLALEHDGFEVCAEAATGRRALEQALETRPDIALLDIHMPDGTGVWAAYEISEALPSTLIVMLTYSREDEDVFSSLRAGACGYLLKDMDPERLGTSLRNVIEGEVVFPRSLMSKIVDQFGDSPRKPQQHHPSLTAREAEVADLLCTGASTDDIAERLSMSAVTARVHISNIVKKLRVSSREEAVALLSAGSYRT